MPTTAKTLISLQLAINIVMTFLFVNTMGTFRLMVSIAVRTGLFERMCPALVHLYESITGATIGQKNLLFWITPIPKTTPTLNKYTCIYFFVWIEVLDPSQHLWSC